MKIIILVIILGSLHLFCECKLWTEKGKTDEELKAAYYCVNYDMWNQRELTKGERRIYMQKVLKQIGSPHLTIPTFHITGTNGKGSVTHKLAAAINAAGYTSGEYTSPMIYTFRENIQVNGTKISQIDYVKHHQICALAERNVRKRYKNLPKIMLGTYGLEFCMAFSYFRAAKVNAAMIEVNIGGLKDHTNVLRPEGVVIVNVKLQPHGNHLPNSVGGILRRKAAIINPGHPVVVGHDMPLKLLHSIAKKKGSPVHIVYPLNHTNFSYDEYNGMIMEKMLEVAGSKFPNLSDEAICKGKKAKLPLRSEYVQDDVLEKLKVKWGLTKLPYKVLLEMKSDVLSIETIIPQLKKQHNGRRVRVLVTLLRDWNVKDRIIALFKHADEIHLLRTTNLRHPVAIEKYNLTKMAKNTPFEKYSFDYEFEKEEGDLERAIVKAFIASSEAKEEEILVLMNLSSMNYKLLGMDYETDKLPQILPTIKECRTKLILINTQNK